MIRLIILIGSFFHLSQTVSQSLLIEGRLSDLSTGQGVPFSAISFYDKASAAILGYTYSNDSGRYKLNIQIKNPILTIRIQHMAYEPYFNDIIIADSIMDNINLEFKLVPKIMKLDEVVIHGPIIVKEDTTIYDIKNWLETKDESLEDVLRKIPGFRITPDGEIVVNGKKIQKVVVNGKELSDVGASLITRSIAPENIKSIEVRFNEQDSRLKESLLDTREYVVLDIKLKEEINSFFGKIRATIGHTDAGQLGYFANSFYLGKKFNAHMFSEMDDFGHQSISITNIKNLGQESLQKMYEIPSNFNEFTQRQEYDDELYGIKNYTRSANRLFGTSIKFDLGENAALYFGSYSYFKKLAQDKVFEQQFYDGASFNANSFSVFDDLSSKNKLEYRLNKENLKLSVNQNFIYDSRQRLNMYTNESDSLNIKFFKQTDNWSYYLNGLLEYKTSDYAGIQLKTSIVRNSGNTQRRLNHNDTLLAMEYGLLTQIHTMGIRQVQELEQNNWIADINYQLGKQEYGGKAGVFFKLIEEKRIKLAEATGIDEVVSSVMFFSGRTPLLSTWQLEPYLSQYLKFDDFNFSGKIGLSNVYFPDNSYDMKYVRLLTYQASLTLNPFNNGNISLGINRKISEYPLANIALGADLIDFQNVGRTRIGNFEPMPETVINFGLFKSITRIGVEYDLTVYYGQINNVNQTTAASIRILENNYSQLISKYLLVSSPVSAKAASIPITIVFEPEAIFTSIENSVDSIGIFNVNTNILLTGIKISSKFDKIWNFQLYPKHTFFFFQSPALRQNADQQIFSFSINNDFKIAKERFLVSAGARYVMIKGTADLEYIHPYMKLIYSSKSLFVFMELDNLLNNSSFLIQTAGSNFFMTEKNTVFGRYIKFGLEYRFK